MRIEYGTGVVCHERMMHWHYVMASVPAALVSAYRMGIPDWLGLLAVSLATAWTWSFVIARARKRAVDPVWLPAGWLFALIVPPAIAPVYVVLALSFGLVFGCHAFGGSGRYLVSPVLLGAVFLATGYPAALDGIALPGAAPDTYFLLACLAGAIYLMAIKAAAPSVVAGGVAGLAVTGWLLAELPATWQLANGQFALLLAFIATDQSTRPQTTAGSWAFGILFGALTIGLHVASPNQVASSWAALLLASLFAPALDQLTRLLRRMQGSANNA